MAETHEGSVKPSSIEKDTYEQDLFAQRSVDVPSNMQVRADYNGQTDSQPAYSGWAPKGLSESSTGWLLHKNEYDANRQFTKRTVAYDSWDNHLTASYS